MFTLIKRLFGYPAYTGPEDEVLNGEVCEILRSGSTWALMQRQDGSQFHFDFAWFTKGHLPGGGKIKVYGVLKNRVCVGEIM